MQSSKVTTIGLFPDDIEDDALESGTGWVIGDGVTLTAGHVVFEYNRSRTTPTILDGSNSIFLDFEDYEARYLCAHGDTCNNPQTIPSASVLASAGAALGPSGLPFRPAIRGADGTADAFWLAQRGIG